LPQTGQEGEGEEEEEEEEEEKEGEEEEVVVWEGRGGASENGEGAEVRDVEGTDLTDAFKAVVMSSSEKPSSVAGEGGLSCEGCCWGAGTVSVGRTTRNRWPCVPLSAADRGAEHITACQDRQGDDALLLP